MGSDVIFDNLYLDRRLRFGWYLDVIMLFLLGDFFLCLDSIQMWIWMIGITHLMIDDLMLSDFLIYHTSNVILGHIPSWLRFIDLHWFVWSSPLTRCMSSWWSIFLFYHNSPMELLLSHSIKLILSDIVTVLRWGYLKVHRLSYLRFSGVHVGFPRHPHWSILESMTNMLTFIGPSGIFLSWWQTHSLSSPSLEYLWVDDKLLVHTLAAHFLAMDRLTHFHHP